MTSDGHALVRVLMDDAQRAINNCTTFNQTEYARRYFTEATYRFNRSEMLPRFTETMTTCTPWRQSRLRAAEDFRG